MWFPFLFLKKKKKKKGNTYALIIVAQNLCYIYLDAMPQYCLY